MAAEKQEISEDENRIEIVYKPAKQIVIRLLSVLEELSYSDVCEDDPLRPTSHCTMGGRSSFHSFPITS